MVIVSVLGLVVVIADRPLMAQVRARPEDPPAGRQQPFDRGGDGGR
jgi:hypothetical protein